MLKIKSLRLAAGLTLEQVAQKIGVSNQAVSKWECGESFPTADKLPRLASIFGVSIDDLYSDAM